MSAAGSIVGFPRGRGTWNRGFPGCALPYLPVYVPPRRWFILGLTRSVPANLTAYTDPANLHVLTFDKDTGKLAQFPSAQTALVEVERYTQEAPPITAFEPPV